MTDDDYRPFKGLSKRLPHRPADKTGPAMPDPAPVPEPAEDGLPEDDAELFLRTVAGAAPPEAEADDALTHSPFKTLSKKNKKKAKAAPAPPATPSRAPEPDPGTPLSPPPPDDEASFLKAMQDVKPLDGKGRDRPARPEPGPAPPPSGNPDDYVRRRLEQLVGGEVVFDCSMTDEYAAGQVRGLDPRVFNKLKAGAYAVEAHLDLHGLTLEPAWQETTAFIRRQYELGRRCLLLVTGRGLNSPDGRGVLRVQVQSWLTREPLRRVVLAFVTAQPRHGGAGALYVLLRKFKKSGGKVRWDRMPPDLDLP